VADSILKRCSKCGTLRPFSRFYLRNGVPRAACKECMDKQHRAYVAEHRERVAEYKSIWGAENAEARKARYAANESIRLGQLARSRKWTEGNPERRAAIAQNYKHRRRAQEEGGISSADLLAWKKAKPKICYWCGKKCARSFTVDHYQPLAKGGRHEASNLVIACRSCNLKKNAKDPEQFRAETWHGTLFSSLISP
jgi:5-methylcytosine-specific restriction endonuclease McrA